MSAKDLDVQSKIYSIEPKPGLAVDIDLSAASWIGTGRLAQEDGIMFGVNKADNVSGFNLKPTQFGAAVYDGHGGSAVAEQLVNQATGLLPMIFLNSGDSLVKLFESYDKTYFSDPMYNKVGSTAALTCIRNGVLEIAHCGDSRVIVFDEAGKIVYETKDHNPDQHNLEEIQRIRALGGDVFYGRVNGIIAVSRSFGDWGYEGKNGERLVIPTPDVHQIPLEAGKKLFLMQFSDGITDYLGYPKESFANQKLVTVVQHFFKKGFTKEQVVKILLLNMGKFNFAENAIKNILQMVKTDKETLGLGTINPKSNDNVSFTLYSIDPKTLKTKNGSWKFLQSLSNNKTVRYGLYCSGGAAMLVFCIALYRWLHGA